MLRRLYAQLRGKASGQCRRSRGLVEGASEELPPRERVPSPYVALTHRRHKSHENFTDCNRTVRIVGRLVLGCGLLRHRR